MTKQRVGNLSKITSNQTLEAQPLNFPNPNPLSNVAPHPFETDPLERLITELNAIQFEMHELEAAEFARLSGLHHTQTESARNLIHYLALRRHDRRRIQEKLSLNGLSSLGRAESHVKASVDAIAGVLRVELLSCLPGLQRRAYTLPVYFSGGNYLNGAHLGRGSAAG